MKPRPYKEVSSAPGVWFSALTPPLGTAVEAVSGALIAGTTEQLPVCALVQHDAAEIANEVILLRDPSSSHGTPDIGACDIAADSLARSQRWEYCIGRGRTTGSAVLWVARAGSSCWSVCVGSTPLTPPSTPALTSVRGWPPAESPAIGYGPAGCCRSGDCATPPRCCSEPAALVCAPAAALPAIADAAASLHQERIVVAGLRWDCTYALGRR